MHSPGNDQELTGRDWGLPQHRQEEWWRKRKGASMDETANQPPLEEILSKNQAGANSAGKCEVSTKFLLLMLHHEFLVSPLIAITLLLQQHYSFLHPVLLLPFGSARRRISRVYDWIVSQPNMIVMLQSMLPVHP